MRIATARYRLLFKRPFTTAHGTRDGTDSVFVRLEHADRVGHGEATLPPYVKEDPTQVALVIDAFTRLVLSQQIVFELDRYLKSVDEFTSNAPAARNALSMAGLDLAAQLAGQPLWAFLGMPRPPGRSKCMVTLATDTLEDVEERLRELPPSPVLKVKLGQPHDHLLIERLERLDDRMLLLDANQGLRSVADALGLVLATGTRAIAMEQPFAAGDASMHGALQARVGIPVIADESVQGPEELAAVIGVFGGVNVKLMKCGGLIRAHDMIRTAQANGLRVMLGSMSESTLGSLAMFHLSGAADWVDLDGPWLLRNDPFTGMPLPSEQEPEMNIPGIGAGSSLDLFAYN